jgi:O-antigen/teichoic acid export membrane protein
VQEKLLNTLDPILVPNSVETKETKKHIRGSALLLSGRLIAVVINLGIQILLVRYLSKSGYGAFAYALSIVSLASSVAVFGLDKAVSRFVAIYKEQQEYGKVLGTILLMGGTILSLGVAIVLLVFGLQRWLYQSLIHDQEAMVLLLILIALSPIQALECWFIGVLSVFGKPRSIFFRKHLVGPCLYFLVVLLLVLGGAGANVIAAGYLTAGIAGVLISTATLIYVVRKNGLLNRATLKRIKIPAGEVFSFTTPLLVSDFVFVLRTQFVVVLLQYFASTTEVANYRSVFPVARINLIVYQTFLILFMPLASQMFARKDQEGMNDLYRQTAIWIAVLTFPVFAVTSSLSKPLTMLFFGSRYEESALVLMLLSLGFYFSAALGFNGQSLRIFGKVRFIFVTDLLMAAVTICLSFALIPRYGALGAAISTTSTLMLQNVLYQIGVMYHTGAGWFSLAHLKIYAIIALGWAALLLLPPLSISFLVAAFVSVVVFLLSRKLMDVRRMFPELLHLPLMRRIFSN